MGTLDDAIREHLELKRRSGAPESEVTKLESEAFGPARREPPRPAGEPVAPTAAPAAEELPPPPSAAPPLDAPPAPPAPPSAPVFSADEPTAIEQPVPPRRRPEEWLEDDEAPHTAEFTAAEARDAGGEVPSDYVAPDEEGDDLLEETPDFLQETPEHDRLWFEQKPPRDFDFDQ